MPSPALKLFGLVTVLCVIAPLPRASASEADRTQLLSGVREIASPGIPGSVAVYGPDAFPVIVGKAGEQVAAPVIAAARLGKGRIIALGHDGYFGKETLETADTGQILVNAVTWAAADKAAPRVGVIGLRETLAFLLSRGLNARPIAADADFRDVDVLVLMHDGVQNARIPAVRDFVRSGGGLIAGSTGWGWSQITGLPMTQHPLSRITAAAGIAWTSGMLDRTSPQGFSAAREIPRYVHSQEALSALLSRRVLSPAETAQAVSSSLLAARSLPDGDTLFLPRLRALRKAVGASAVPTAMSPITLKEPLQRLALALDTDEAQRAAPSHVTAAASAADFPGAVPADAPRVTRRLAIDASVPGWHSTGLYAAPGERIQVTLPAAAVKSGFSVRIGAHTDELWHLAAWQRAPAITRAFALTAEKTEAANAFGGPIYLVVPETGAAGTLQATISGAVEAPYFKLGVTSLADWRGSTRNRPGPWAEIEGRKIIFTVPSELIRNLDNPNELMALWDRVAAAQENLVGEPARIRPERIVTDRQISAGYMHSGYPIMTPVDGSAKLAMDAQKLKAEGSWGHFHELGHNLQSGDWTFAGTGEVTNNVLAMNVYESVLSLPFDSGHPAIRDRAQRMERVRQYIAKGARFETWQSDPFLALTMYIQLIEGFGWKPFRQVFAEYRALPAGERPRTDEEKRDRWMRMFSLAVGRNLGPFYQRWGVPTSSAARASLDYLPVWMPADMPKP